MTAYLLDLPLTPYEDAHELQQRLVAARADGTLDRDVVILVEHPPVYTLGKNGGRENLVVSEDFLAERGISVVQTERGGNITWHGPGQLVAYPITHLQQAGLGVKAFVEGLEKVMIDTLAALGVAAVNDEDNRGVWVGPDKIGSLGIRVRRGVSFHGLALNICPDLTGFSWINPCGLTVAITTAAMQLGREVALDDARAPMVEAFRTMFPGGLEPTTREQLEGVLA